MADPLYCPWLLAAPCLKPEVWAAWWQAIGSVVAILVAVLVPLRLQRQANLAKVADAKAKARSLAVDVLDDMTALTASIQALHEDGYKTLGDVYGYASAVFRIALPARLKDAVKQLHELGPAGSTLQLALLELSFLRGKLMECGSRSDGTRNGQAVTAAKRSLDAVLELMRKASEELGQLFDEEA
ncbi:hypothetical protein OCJ37_19760 [Xanthomonas sp. AM6]|uniref:hypothetical protein n=1 Tax=Xanthomonas sp. AM6 TaxID=2982531 RepID=UPI0021DA9E7F|nr:hypothetical protein [Xanthomonas sp. AM6]UYB52170.1 hypothetical protein OCJ37_19760 [Xanthomonas sp. AM6]